MRPYPLLLASLLTVGCTTWRAMELPAPQAAIPGGQAEYRLTTIGGQQLRGDSLWIVGDTLMLRPSLAGTPVAVPRAQVGLLERHVIDGGKTGGMIFGVLALSLVLLLAVAASLDGLGGGGGY